MVNASSIFSGFKAPGVRLSETTSGYRVLEIASFSTVYIIGSSSSGSYLTPTQITSLTDFTNVFGSSPSEAAVKLFFRNDRRGLLFFVRTPKALAVQITVNTATTGDYPLVISTSGGSATVTYTATSGLTTAQIATGLITAINSSSVASAVTAIAGSATNKIKLIMDNPIYPFLSVTSTNSGVAIANSYNATDDRRLVTINNVPTSNTNYSLYFFTEAITIANAATSSSTKSGIRDALVAAINANVTLNVKYLAVSLGTDQFYITNVSGTVPVGVFVVSGGNGLSVNNDSIGIPSATDYVYSIENSFDSEDYWNQGFVIAPEAFQNLTTQSERVSVGLALEALASDESFDWVALIDSGSGLTATQAQTEGQLYNSPQGHSSFYYPYLTDLEGVVVPPSAAVAGVATRRYKEEGFQQPPAGSKFPILGVIDVVTKINTQQQEVLNPLGINIIRNLRNKGVVVWAMRTRSNNEFYTFISTRVIMNVLNGTLRRGFDNELFTAIDGQSILLDNISLTASSICNRLWLSKALYGANPSEAFEVKCDLENNTPDELERGNVLLEVYVTPSPALEKLLIQTIRVSIGTLPQNKNQLATQVLPTATTTATTN